MLIRIRVARLQQSEWVFQEQNPTLSNTMTVPPPPRLVPAAEGPEVDGSDLFQKDGGVPQTGGRTTHSVSIPRDKTWRSRQASSMAVTARAEDSWAPRGRSAGGQTQRDAARWAQARTVLQARIKASFGEDAGTMCLGKSSGWCIGPATAPTENTVLGSAL